MKLYIKIFRRFALLTLFALLCCNAFAQQRNLTYFINRLQASTNKYIFSFSPSITDKITPINQEINPSLSEAENLNRLLKNTGLTYKVLSGKYIVLIKDESTPERLVDEAAKYVDIFNKRKAMRDTSSFTSFALKGEDKKSWHKIPNPSSFVQGGKDAPFAKDYMSDIYDSDLAYDNLANFDFSPHFAIKSNIIHDLSLSLNIGFEFKVADRRSINLPLSYSHLSFNKHIMFHPQYKVWRDEIFSGYFWGVDAFYSQFESLKLFNKHKEYKGDMFGGGLTFGYSFLVCEWISFEAEVGVGFAHIKYKTNRSESYKYLNSIAPTKLGVNFVYIIK